ncbi:hypothetical protein Mapa_017511 [Marchantia paleacea]|nr:hypothetical protein Mapa_017511 [Marchantia paleacea]
MASIYIIITARNFKPRAKHFEKDYPMMSHRLDMRAPYRLFVNSACTGASSAAILSLSLISAAV